MILAYSETLAARIGKKAIGVLGEEDKFYEIMDVENNDYIYQDVELRFIDKVHKGKNMVKRVRYFQAQHIYWEYTEKNCECEPQNVF